eukprot:gb/GECG01010060.1/.p1 GENE.gb/GECG01010060.1/~~gb/GECG01010060.1/.p1  ORF type:complete len:281 (+),score=39.66 gb/GECG01010060.1/:1-843(+)
MSELERAKKEASERRHRRAEALAERLSEGSSPSSSEGASPSSSPTRRNPRSASASASASAASGRSPKQNTDSSLEAVLASERERVQQRVDNFVKKLLSQFQDVSAQPLGDSVVGFKRRRLPDEENEAQSSSASNVDSSLEQQGRILSYSFQEALHGYIQRIVLSESVEERQRSRYELLDMFHDEATCHINSYNCTKVGFVDALLTYFQVYHIQLVVSDTRYFPESDGQNRIRQLGLLSFGKMWSVSLENSPEVDMELRITLTRQEETQKYLVTEYIFKHS